MDGRPKQTRLCVFTKILFPCGRDFRVTLGTVGVEEHSLKMASRSFVESDEEEFEFDGNSHMFDPEYTDEELEDMERRQREEQLQEATLMAW